MLKNKKQSLNDLFYIPKLFSHLSCWIHGVPVILMMGSTHGASPHLSEDMFALMENTKIISEYRTDHSAIVFYPIHFIYL
jgi:hypothetical protein